MKAIIMAGGEGTRLRPLTCDCPKPMMRMMNRPVMAYAVDLLKKHGISDISVTLGYLPDAVTDYFSDGAEHSVSIRYYIEHTPMGTAGGVGAAREHLNETFIVLSGDGLTDLDITKAAEFHRQNKALATIVLKNVENPFEYGVVTTDKSGQITGFIEKPDSSNVFSAAVNTGIYILEPDIFRYIPEDKPYDFGGELFPSLVEMGIPVYGYCMEGYWCDIGDINAYINAHIHAMEGQINLPGCKPYICNSADIHPSAIIESPCCIGENVKIGENARIGAYTVIGSGCTIGRDASIKRSVLWNDVQIDAGAQARGCVLAAESRLLTGAQVYESAVLGPAAELGERSVLLPGIKIWPGKCTAAGQRVEANLVWGNVDNHHFSRGTLPIAHPSQAMLAGQAFVSVFKPRRLLLGRSVHPIANVLWHAAAAGAMAQGVQVMDAGVCPIPMLRHAMKTLDCDGGAMLTENAFIPLQPNGAYLIGKQQRSLLALYTRQDFPKPFTAAPLSIIRADTPDLSYTAEACRRFTADVQDSPGILLFCSDRTLCTIAESVLARIGLNIRIAEEGRCSIPSAHEIGLHIDPSGERFNLSDWNGPLSEIHRQLFYAWTAIHTGIRNLLLPVSASRTVSDLAKNANASVEYVGGESMAWQNTLAQQYPEQFTLYTDGIQAALSGISALAAHGLTLEKWRELMPQAILQKRRIDICADKAGYILESFIRNIPDASPDCGVRFSRKNGWAWICPTEDMSAFRIVTESASSETARELCDFCANEIRRLSE